MERLPIVSLDTIRVVLQNASHNPEDFISFTLITARAQDPHSGLAMSRLPNEWLEPRNAVRWMGRIEWWFFESLGRSLVWSAIYEESRMQRLAFPSSPKITPEDILALSQTVSGRFQETGTKVEEDWAQNPLSKIRDGLIREEFGTGPEIIMRSLPLALLTADRFELSENWLDMIGTLKDGIQSWKRKHDKSVEYALNVPPEQIYTPEELSEIDIIMTRMLERKVDQEVNQEDEETTKERLFGKDLTRQLRVDNRMRSLNTLSEMRDANGFLADLVCLGWEAIQKALEEAEFSDEGEEVQAELKLRFLDGVAHQWLEFHGTAWI